MLRAIDLAEAIEAGDLAPSTIAAMAIEAIAAREDEIGAFAHFDAAAFEIAAARIDPGKGLYGLPIAIKDIIDTRDMPTEYGFDGFRGHRPMLDAAIVARIHALGGVVQGKTVTTPFAFLDPAPTKNPHAPLHTPGGSSSGSAAAVAAGMTPIALGTQTGGSIIRPASYCGVAAIKPSFRLLPLTGVKQTSWSLDTLGLFAARAADCAFALEALSGRPMLDKLIDPGAPRIGIFRQAYAGTPDDDAEAALDEARHALESAGSTLVDLAEHPALTRAAAHFAVIYDYEISVCLLPDRQRFGESLPPSLAAAFEKADARPVAAYDEARRIARACRNAARELFDGLDAIITFSTGSAAPKGLASTGDGAFNRIMTLIGGPAVNVPVHWTDEGLPVGIQVLAPFARDAEALAVAAVLEGAIARIA
jgi:Asp-tRNA(Asn)/Glu-tRNA(Gln) amidotransferase A subunit family amidase